MRYYSVFHNPQPATVLPVVIMKQNTSTEVSNGNPTNKQTKCITETIHSRHDRKKKSKTQIGLQRIGLPSTLAKLERLVFVACEFHPVSCGMRAGLRPPP